MSDLVDSVRTNRFKSMRKPNGLNMEVSVACLKYSEDKTSCLNISYDDVAHKSKISLCCLMLLEQSEIVDAEDSAFLTFLVAAKLELATGNGASKKVENECFTFPVSTLEREYKQSLRFEFQDKINCLHDGDRLDINISSFRLNYGKQTRFRLLDGEWLECV